MIAEAVKYFTERAQQLARQDAKRKKAEPATINRDRRAMERELTEAERRMRSDQVHSELEVRQQLLADQETHEQAAKAEKEKAKEIETKVTRLDIKIRDLNSAVRTGRETTDVDVILFFDPTTGEVFQQRLDTGAKIQLGRAPTAIKRKQQPPLPFTEKPAAAGAAQEHDSPFERPEEPRTTCGERPSTGGEPCRLGPDGHPGEMHDNGSEQWFNAGELAAQQAERQRRAGAETIIEDLPAVGRAPKDVPEMNLQLLEELGAPATIRELGKAWAQRERATASGSGPGAGMPSTQTQHSTRPRSSSACSSCSMASVLLALAVPTASSARSMRSRAVPPGGTMIACSAALSPSSGVGTRTITGEGLMRRPANLSSTKASAFCQPSRTCAGNVLGSNFCMCYAFSVAGVLCLMKMLHVRASFEPLSLPPSCPA